MFAADVAMPTPTGIAYGSQKAIDALRGNPANTGAKVEWTPARVAISSDGRHGFTAGFMTMHARRRRGAAREVPDVLGKADGRLARARLQARAGEGAGAGRCRSSYVLPKQITPSKHDAAAIERIARAWPKRSAHFRAMRRRWASARRSRCTAVRMPSTFGGPGQCRRSCSGNQAIGDSVLAAARRRTPAR